MNFGIENYGMFQKVPQYSMVQIRKYLLNSGSFQKFLELSIAFYQIP